MDEEGNLGYYLYNESTGEEKLFSVVEEEERLYFLGEHRGKFGKGGTASGVVFTGKDVLENGADSRLRWGPKGANGGKLLDYVNTENSLRQDNAFNSTLKTLKKKGVYHNHAINISQNASNMAYKTGRNPEQVVKAIKKQKFNRSALGKVLKKVKIR
jgi:hypothetical protein